MNNARQASFSCSRGPGFAWRAAILGLALAACLPCVAGCGDETTTVSTKDIADPPVGCNPLATSDSCMLPFPSAFLTRPDAASPTGVRLNLVGAHLPVRTGGSELDPSYFNSADGFSPIAPILVHFGEHGARSDHVGVEVDVSALPNQHNKDLAKSVAPDATIAIFDLVTGERVPYFSEMDENVASGYDGRYAFIIRPMAPLAMGHRHVVAIKSGLKDTKGHAIVPPDGFVALRDKEPTTSSVLEGARARYEEVFDFLGTHGYARADLLLAWEIPVASRDYVLGSVLSMRAAANAGDVALPYVITNVQKDPNPNVSRIVEGTFEVPTFVRKDLTFDYDADHHPIRQPTNNSYPFTMVIPKVAETSGPLPLGILGHGIFGSGRSFLAGTGSDTMAIQQLANQHGVVVLATDWIGLSQNDLPNIAAALGTSLDQIGVVTDQLQQALINALVLTRLGMNQLNLDPTIRVTSEPLVDTSRVFYWGASLGGIEGSGFVSLSDVIPRAVFGVPGSAWSTMITRSVVFLPLKPLITPAYPDPLDWQILLTALQGRFDHADPANVTKLMFESPLPDAPTNRMVILQESIGDSEVPNVATEILARAMGVSQLIPADHDVWGLPQVVSPSTSSVLAQYRLANYDNPLPPEGDLSPASDNNVHYDMNFLPNAQEQLAELWLEGIVEQYCKAACQPN
jgi:hypothetical protein